MRPTRGAEQAPRESATPAARARGARPAVDDPPQRSGALERLFQVIERAELDRLDRARDVAVRREHDDLQLRLRAPHPPQELHPVEARHLQISHEDVKLAREETAMRGLPVARLLHLVPRRLQRFGEEAADVVVVVDHQDARHELRFTSS